MSELYNKLNTYDGRFNVYSSCFGIEGNFGNCIEQVAGGCQLAQDRVFVCQGLYSGPDDGDAYATCVLNSGINQCQ